MTRDKQIILLVECFGNSDLLFEECFGNSDLLFEENGSKICFKDSVGYWIKYEYNGKTYTCSVLKFVNEYLEKYYPINSLKYKNFMRLKKIKAISND